MGEVHDKGLGSMPDLFLCFIAGTEGHQGPLTCVATNQDGSLILTGSVDCQAKLVSATTGKVSGPRAPWGASAFPSLWPSSFTPTAFALRGTENLACVPSPC